MRATLRARLALTHLLLVAASGLGVIVIAGVLLARTAYQQPPGQVFQAAKEQAAKAEQTNPNAPLDIEGRVVRQLRHDTMIDLVIASGAALGVVTLVSGGAAWWLAGKSLRPLRLITDTARHATSGDLGRRIHLVGPPDEVKGLADTFDAMLFRLQHAFEQQRRFAAHVSHELRTPLAISRTALDLTMAKPAPTPQDLARMTMEINDAIDRSERIIEGLLTLARTQSEPTRRRHTIDLADAVDDALNQAHLNQHTPQPAVTTNLQSAPTTADPALLAQLIANLIDNAVHHNRDHGSINIATHAHGDHAILQITNTCTPVPPDQLATLTEPFIRGGDPAKSTRRSGLGLAIATAIAEAHGGELRLTLPKPDMFSVAVTLPSTGRGAEPAR